VKIVGSFIFIIGLFVIFLSVLPGHEVKTREMPEPEKIIGDFLKEMRMFP
jgi:hypothetical protein